MNPETAEVIADMCGAPLSVVIRTLRVHGHPQTADRLADAGKTRAA